MKTAKGSENSQQLLAKAPTSIILACRQIGDMLSLLKVIFIQENGRSEAIHVLSTLSILRTGKRYFVAEGGSAPHWDSKSERIYFLDDHTLKSVEVSESLKYPR